MTAAPLDHVYALGQSALVMAQGEIGLVYRLPRTVHALVPVVTAINERLERAPGLRWVGAAVILSGEKYG